MLLSTINLSKNFGGLMAVNNVSFAVKKGQIAGIIGPNGSGKTTFFNIISGIYKPASGEVYFNKENITNLPVHERTCRGVARTFQTTVLFSDSTVLDNVIIGHRLHTKTGFLDALVRSARFHADEKKAKQKAWEVLEFTGLDKLAHQYVENIPQEAKKRVAIAMALATDPQLILLDEPAAGINLDEMAGIIELIRKMQKSGLTICLIEHKMQMVMNLAEYIMVLNHGVKIAEGTPEKVANNQVVIEAYLGSDDDVEDS